MHTGESVFRCRSGNSSILIINQPKATNGIKPSFEAYFTVKALATKSGVVNTLHDSINHRMASLDSRSLHYRLNRSRSNWGNIVSSVPSLFMLLNSWRNDWIQSFPFFNIYRIFYFLSLEFCLSFVCLRTLLCAVT